MKSLSQLAFPMWLLFITALTNSCFGAQALTNGWWLQDSPEKVLAAAQAINQNLNYFQAHKTGSTLSQITNPFTKTNQEAYVEFFQRKIDNGFVETKKFTLDGKFQRTDYKLKSGNYIFTYGQLIKMEYDNEERDVIEKTLAVKLDRPYEFKILRSEMVGTNDCIVIARNMTDPFLKATADIFFEKYSPEKRIEMGTNYIRTETHYYFRKNDGIAFGLTKLNSFGEQLEDEVYDHVEINQPISEQEFLLPKGEIKTAKNSLEFHEILMPSVTDPKVEKRVSELEWASDLPAALARAKAESKLVLLDFTGSDWCVWCRKFDNDVLSQPEFATYAKTNLVMVMLDFPNAKPQSESVKKVNKELKEKFKVKGFPTYVALMSDVEQIGRQAGYLNGGPQAFIAELEKFRKP